AVRIMAPSLKERLHRLSQARELLEFLHTDEIDVERDVLLKQGNEAMPAFESLRIAETELRDVEPYTTEKITAKLEDEVERRNWNSRKGKGAFYGPIRVAISGKSKTPPLQPMLAALGKKRTLKRLRDAIDLIAPGVA